MAREKSKRIGRPIKPAPKGAASVSLGLRIPADLKVKLDKASLASGRSQSDEAARRLNHTFDMETVMEEAREMRIVAHFIAAIQEGTNGKTWRDDPETCRRVVAYVVEFFKQYGVKGDNMPTELELAEAAKGMRAYMDLIKPAVSRDAAHHKGEAQ
jgi:hypothetical protein